MADEKREIPAGVFALGLVNAGLAAQIKFMLETGIPASDVMNMLIEHTMKLLSLVEPEQLRNTILGEIRKNLPMVLNRHVTERLRTPGGVILPQPGEMQH